MSVTLSITQILAIASVILFIYAWSRPMGGDYYVPIGRFVVTGMILVFWMAWLLKGCA